MPAPISPSGSRGPGVPRLTNRGAAGLLKKKPPVGVPPVELVEPSDIKVQGINKIAPTLRDAGLVVPVESLTFDPENARVHPERNLEAIRQSLTLYGQLKPIVVRKETMVVVAGNGTLEAAKALGWTEVAANIVDMTAVEAAGYGLADNRTAELAKWDFEIVARLDKLISAANHPEIGWTKDELEVLRMADWTPPPAEEVTFGGDGTTKGLLIGFTPDEMEAVRQAVAALRTRDSLPEDSSEAELIAKICMEWYISQLPEETDAETTTPAA